MKLTYQELSNNPGSFLAKAANGAKGAVCGAYHDYKDWYHSNIDLASPAGLLIESFWDLACPMEPPYQAPPPPPPTFQGGQCCGTTYRVNIRATNNGGASYFEVLLQGYYTGKILGVKQNKSSSSGQVRISHDLEWQNCSGTISKENVGSSNDDGQVNIVVKNVFPAFGGADNCGNPPSSNPPPPLAPPDKINRDITIDNDGVPLTIPFSFSPKFNLPGLSINGNLNIFAPRFNFNLAPQFNLAPGPTPNSTPPPPPLNINFDLGGVNFNLGGSSDNDTTNNNNVNNNINNISNNLNNVSNNVNNVNNTVNNINNNTDKTNDDVTIIKDKLACNPCDLLEEIKEKLDYVPTYEGFFVPEFQSIKLDNLANLGYIEIDVTVFPNKTKVIYGGNAPNVLFSGWITWRKNGYNFSREQVTAQSSIYYAPKGANGFSICCTHNSRASCLYYIEIKD